MPMARNTVSMGCVPRISRVVSTMTFSPAFDLNRTTYSQNSTCIAASRAKLFDHAVDQLRRRPWCIEMLVREVHRLPLEGAELMKRLHLDPLDVFHRCDKPRDTVDIRGVVGDARHQRKPHPYRFANRREPLGKTQGWCELTPGHFAIGVRIRTLDVEQHQIEAGQYFNNTTTTEKSRCLDGGMKAHLLGRGKDSPREVDLHHRFSARDRQPAIERAQRRGKAAQPIDDLLRRNVSSILQMPGVGIVAIGAAQ